MPVIRAQIVLPFMSGLPEDVAVNTWHFDAPNFDTATRAAIQTRIDQFFNTATANGHVISASLANVLNRGAGAASVRYYNLADPEPREPVVVPFTLGPKGFSTAVDLPAEIALVGSYYATRNLPQRRGRTYLGPWVSSIGVKETTDIARPQTATVTGIAQAFARLIAANNTVANFGIYSRPKEATTNKDGSPNPARPGTLYVATAGFVNNAWDVQRRRGQDPSTRVTF